MAVEGTVVRGAAGQPLRWLGITRDITARKQVEDKLAKSEREIRGLLEALPAAICMTDAVGNITYYNVAAVALWGYSPALGQSKFCGSWRLYRSDGTPLPHDECPMAMALRLRKPIRGAEAIVERPDGTRVPFIPFPTPLFDAGGALIGGVNMLVEISERLNAIRSWSLREKLAWWARLPMTWARGQCRYRRAMQPSTACRRQPWTPRVPNGRLESTPTIYLASRFTLSAP